MIKHNAYHFHKNYPDIEIKLPKDTTKEYLESLKNKYDLLFANPPCSGLSTINRHAGANNATNIHIYEVINVVKIIQPKVFLIENAPTLTSTGLPILKDIASILNDNYRLLIINDRASNHNVSMHRRRTFVIGFNKTYFAKIPRLGLECNELLAKEVFKDINLRYNKEFIKDTNENIFKYYDIVKPGQSFYKAMALNNIKDLPTNIQKNVDKIKYKFDNNLREWDKSNYRIDAENQCPSLTSLTRLIHPFENRDLYIREYASIMGYPENFVFYPDECRTHPIQCIAQGVPVNFIRYISKEIMNSFKATEFIDGEIVYINQCNIKSIKEKVFNTLDEFKNISSLIK